MTTPTPVALIELRTHGVSGTPPEAMLDAAQVVQVAGDAKGRFFQAADVYGQPVPRAPGGVLREGYHWGRMTSGGFAQALWAALLPFAIVNLAHWMIPPVPEGWGRVMAFVLRALVRVVGLLLTMLLVVQLTVIVADVAAAQTVMAATPRIELRVATLLRDHPGWLAGAVAAAIFLPVLGLIGLTSVSRNRLYTDQDAPTRTLRPSRPKDGPKASIAEPAFFDYAVPVKTFSRTLHAVGALGAASIVLSETRSWTAIFGLLLVCVVIVATLLLDVLRGRLKCVAPRVATWAAVPAWLVAGACLAAAAWGPFLSQVRTRTGAPLASVEAVVEDTIVALAFACLFAALATVAVAIASSRSYPRKDVPRPHRVWLFGTGAAFLLPLAGLIGGGLGTAATQAARSCMTLQCRPTLLASTDPTGPTAPKIYEAVSLLCVLLARAWFRPDPVAVRLQSTKVASSPPGPPGPKVAWFVARINKHTHQIVAAVVGWAVVAGFIAPVATEQRIAQNSLFHYPAQWLGVEQLVTLARRHDHYATAVAFLQGAGVVVLAGMFFGLLWAIYNAQRRPDTAGRGLGVIWDLLSFWPSEGHPLVPPCYARKAVVNLTERAKWWLAKPEAPKLVLCGHSQGSLLMYTTALRLAGDRDVDMTRVGLVTYGSQLQWAYGRGFPSMLSYYSHAALMKTLDGRWFNLIRFTDPIGGPVLSWDLTLQDDVVSARGLKADGEGDLSAPAPYRGARYVGNELWLPDPIVRPPEHPKYEPPIFAMRKHSEYTLDDQWPGVLRRAAGPSDQPGEPVTTQCV